MEQNGGNRNQAMTATTMPPPALQPNGPEDYFYRAVSLVADDRHSDEILRLL